MKSTGLESSRESFPELYLDLVWNLAASSGIMRLKLPVFATAASDSELVAVIGACLTITIEHHDALEAIVSREDRPARVHAAELEDLLGTAARQFAGQSSGPVRDVAFASLLRTVLHLAIPSYELAATLAGELGYDSQDRTLGRFRDEIATVDSHLERITQRLVMRHVGESALADEERPVPRQTEPGKMQSPPDERDAIGA
jgi:ferritin-like metal-binding protein YciE